MARYKYIDSKKHLHTLDGKPLIGTSNVPQIINKPQLIGWAARMSVEWIRENCAWDQSNPTNRTYHVTEKELEKAKNAHEKRKKDSAKTGTERHKTLEDYVKNCMSLGGRPIPQSQEYAEEINAFIDWAMVNINKFLWCEANCYHEGMWTGGVADIGYEDKDGKVVAGDHKSSDKAYFEQFVQIAGYDLALEHSGGLTPDGEKIYDYRKVDYYAVFPFRSKPFTPEFRFNVNDYKDAFRAGLLLYKLKESNV